MEDEIVYEDTIGSLDTSREQLVEARDDAMDWMDEYYQSPEEASLVSENLEQLLDPTSKYMIEAQDASAKARSGQGYLDSGFNRGMGTVAAIDNAFDVALDDAYVDVFNTNQYNLQYRQDYLAAYNIAMKAMTAQDQQSFGEYGYSLIIASMDEAQEDLLELKDKEYEYADLLQTSKHDDNMDRLHLKHSNDLANRILRNTSGLQGYYLESFTSIIGSRISLRDKYDQLTGLGYQIDKATTAAVNQQYTKVGDNPYGISYIELLPGYDIGERGDEAFVFSVHDAKFEYVKFREMLDPIRAEIHDVTEHAQREESTLWYVVNDLLTQQLNGIDKNSQAFIDKMEFYNRTKYDRLGNDPTNDEIEQYFRDMYEISSTPAEAKQRQSYYRASRSSSSYELGITNPYTYTVTTWDSEAEELVKTKVSVPGNTAYYDAIYEEYENRVDDGWGIITSKPAGYDQWKADQRDEWDFGY